MENNFLFIFSCQEVTNSFFFSSVLTQGVQLAPQCVCVCMSNPSCKGTKAFKLQKGNQSNILYRLL